MVWKNILDPYLQALHSIHLMSYRTALLFKNNWTIIITEGKNYNITTHFVITKSKSHFLLLFLIHAHTFKSSKLNFVDQNALVLSIATFICIDFGAITPLKTSNMMLSISFCQNKCKYAKC